MKIFKKIVIGIVFYTFPLAILCFLIIGIYENNNIPYLAGFYLFALVYALFWTLITLFLTITMFFSKGVRNDGIDKTFGD